MAIEKVNEEINLEIEPNSAQEIDAPVMEGDAMILDDGSAIVNPAEDTTDQGAFNANLADLIPEDELESLASGLMKDYEYDKDARADWLKSYTDGLDLLGFKYEDRSKPFAGASGVTHPLLAETVTQFQAQAYKELLPPEGPVRTQIVGEITKKFSGDKIGIHCHNDTENAVANSLAAIDAGARHLQGTINGLGERCGNANLISIIPTLLLKKEYSEKYDISIDVDKLSELKNLSRLVDDILNKHPNNHQPYVGENAFAHKGGLHVSAVMKDPTTYEHVNPELVGNNRKILVSNQAGKSNLLSRLESIGMEINSDDKRINKLLEIVKEKEFQGYSYDGAGASFEILAKNVLDQVPTFFSVESYEVTISGSKDNSSLSKANISINVDDRIINSLGEGNGPVNALDNALRKDLGIYNEYIQDLILVDYKVRILDGGTEAITRVVIESSDSKNQSWFTVGISPNIIEASFEALMDSINYKLIKSNIK